MIDTRGERDARYIRRVIKTQRSLELGSRVVLLASLFPPAWLVGTAGLCVAKILENMEIGHNILHGQWDWMRDPKIHSTTWEWDSATPADAVEARAQRAAPQLHQRDRQGQRPRLRHHARRRGPALASRCTSASRCGTSSTRCFFEYGIAAYDLELRGAIAARHDQGPEVPARGQGRRATRSAAR